MHELILGGQDVILCTHEMGFARAVADVVAFVAAGRITASYTGTTTCEGPITDGRLTVTR